MVVGVRSSSRAPFIFRFSAAASMSISSAGVPAIRRSTSDEVSTATTLSKAPLSTSKCNTGSPCRSENFPGGGPTLAGNLGVALSTARKHMLQKAPTRDLLSLRCGLAEEVTLEPTSGSSDRQRWRSMMETPQRRPPCRSSDAWLDRRPDLVTELSPGPGSASCRRPAHFGCRFRNTFGRVRRNATEPSARAPLRLAKPLTCSVLSPYVVVRQHQRDAAGEGPHRT